MSTWDTVRTSYWFLPMLMALLAALLAVVLVEIDARLAEGRVRAIPWIQEAGAEGTRALLSTVAGSMITVAGVAFSITIVALTLASSQFGPRLLRNFLRDRGNQLVLGTFVATFLYSLIVLWAVEADRVPHVATAVSLGLSVASVFVLIYFVHHAASSIQAASVIAAVGREIDAAMPILFPDEVGEAADEAFDPSAAEPIDGPEIAAEASGYVRVVASDDLHDLAVERDLVIQLTARPGDFLAEGATLARVSPAERFDDELADRVREAFTIGAHRSAVQDLAFLTEQLAEMAVRALSPGTNDPKTAVACLERLGVVIAVAARRRMPSPDRYDEQGRLRIVAPATRFADVVASCLDPVRRYGAKDADVVEAALRALAGAARGCPVPARRELLVEHMQEWLEGFSRSDGPKRDRERVAAAAARVVEAARGAAPTSG